ncbi:MAG: hypothetical protein H6707_13205 [Deltaproteobacteria bacterium]|nr:hypothetical protein [Deltaproteobacteria bacterium]
MTATAGINGFGRFGLHLLKYWLDRADRAAFSIQYINDARLDRAKALEIIASDPYVDFRDYRFETNDDGFTISGRDGLEQRIVYSNAPTQNEIPWLGSPRLFLECSGDYTAASRSRAYLRDSTTLVLISATSWDADATLVYGHNHQTFDRAKHRVISYGSCTVNGYVPLADYIEAQYGVIDSDVHVVHNVPLYRVGEHKTLQRKFCTLERSGPLLLPFIDQNKNFAVIYSIVPWAGTSMIDFRFRLRTPPTREQFFEDFRRAIDPGGRLDGLYGLDQADVGPQALNCTPHSAVIIANGVRMLGDNLYLQAYFDTENSVNRYFDLTDYLAQQ